MENIYAEMQETKTRFFAFVEKLEARMKEFTEASIPELVALNDSEDNIKQGFYRMKAAVDGQLNSIKQKAVDVFDEKTSHFLNATNRDDAYYNFREECQNRLNKLEELYHYYQQQVDETDYEDYEIAYQEIVDEFNEIKNKFNCVQCSSPVLIDKMYFTTTYITCPSCQTQNTYQPSTKAKQLEHLGRSLAEQRTKHLLVAHSQLPQKQQDIYVQKHHLEVSLFNEKDQKVIAEKSAQIAALEKEKQELETQSPILYKTYLRAMFDEWNKINPAMEQEHEKFYIRLLTDNTKYNQL